MWTYSYYGKGILDKKVEYQSDEWNEGQHSYADDFLLVCSIQFFLSYMPIYSEKKKKKKPNIINDVMVQSSSSSKNLWGVSLLNVISKFLQDLTQLQHVLWDGVEVLHGTGDVFGSFLSVKGVVQYHLIAVYKVVCPCEKQLVWVIFRVIRIL